MANRVRNKQIIVRVTEEERALIDLKMSQLPTSRLNSNVAGEHKKVTAKNVENTAEHNGECRKRRIVIIAQKCRKHLVEQKKRKHIFYRTHIFMRKSEQRFVGAEKCQNFRLKDYYTNPRNDG